LIGADDHGRVAAGDSGSAEGRVGHTSLVFAFEHLV